MKKEVNRLKEGIKKGSITLNNNGDFEVTDEYKTSNPEGEDLKRNFFTGSVKGDITSLAFGLLKNPMENMILYDDSNDKEVLDKFNPVFSEYLNDKILSGNSRDSAYRV